MGLGLLASACASGAQLVQRDPQAGEDTAARVERLLSYCQRMSDTGDYLLARGMCLRAHNLDQKDTRPLMLLAEVLVQLERPDAAIEAYRKVLENHPDDVEALYRLGKTYLQVQNQELALSAFMAALRLAPSDSRLHNAVAVMSDRQGKHAKAQVHYRKALEVDPDNLSVRSNLGLSLALGGNTSEAVAVLSQVVAEPGASRVSYNNLQVAYQAIDRAQAKGLAHNEKNSEGADQSLPVEPQQAAEKGAKGEKGTARMQQVAKLEAAPLAPLELPPYMADVAIVAHLDNGSAMTAKASPSRNPSRKPMPLPDLPGPLSDTAATRPPIPLLGPAQLRAKPPVKAAGTG